MAAVLTYERGHLLVAAIRVLKHTNGRSPDEIAVADLVNLPPEVVRTALAHLADSGIVRIVRTPFEARVELGDHTALESLPHEKDEPRMEEEVKQFLGGKKDRHQGLTTLFRSGEMDERSKQKHAGLEEKLKGFRPRTPGPFPEDE